MASLRDRVCVCVCVAGASGIAAVVAGRFAADGATVLTISIDGDECAALHDGLPADRAPNGWIAADLRDEDQAVAAFAACIERFGRIDGLFAVAEGSGRSLGDGSTDSIRLVG